MLDRRQFVRIATAGAAMVGSPNAAAAAAVAPNLQEETGYVDVPGGKVWWMRAGSGSKTPLLLLHGGPGAGHNYLLSMRALADERPVIFYDQLGCGRSDSPEDDSRYTIARSVEELDAVRNALGLDRVVLFGSSWGSMLAIEYFVTRGGPGVEKLVLSGALASPDFSLS